MRPRSRTLATSTQRVIIRAVPGKRSALKTRLAAKKEPVLREFTKLDAVVSSVPGTDLLALSDDPSVGSISIDAPLKAHAEPGTPAGLPYSLANTLGISTSTYTGANIGVAVIDSGISRASDFSRVFAYYDFRTDGKAAVSNGDLYGHGTPRGGSDRRHGCEVTGRRL